MVPGAARVDTGILARLNPNAKESAMPKMDQTDWKQIAGQLENFFVRYPNPALKAKTLQAMRAMQRKVACPAGNPSGWAGGILYAAANDGKTPVGIPGLLNSEVEKFFGVTMGTIRRRAARVSAPLLA